MSRYDYDPGAVDVRNSFGCLSVLIGGGVMLVWWVSSCTVNTPWRDKPKPPDPPAAVIPVIPDPDAEAVRRARARLGLPPDGQPQHQQQPTKAKP